MQTLPNELNSSERKRIFEFLKSHPVGVLATISPDGRPHASTIYLTVDESLNLAFTTKQDTRKYQNIEHDNHVMLAVYDAQTQTVVQISGRAEEVTDPDAQHAIYYGTLHAARQTGKDVVPPIAKIAAGPYVGFKVKIENIWLSDYDWGDTFVRALKDIEEPHATGDPA